MYHVYLCTAYDRAFSWSETRTASAGAAAEAFAELVNCTLWDGHELAAVLVLNQQNLAIHRFDQQPGDLAYWRGRLDRIEWDKHAAAPRHAVAR